MFTKRGAPGDGQTIEVKPHLSKLGSKVKCGKCGKSFTASLPSDYARKICPACDDESR